MKHGEIKSIKLKSGIGINAAAVSMVVLGLMVIAAIPTVQAAQGGAIDDKTALQTSISHLKARASDWGIKDAEGEFRLRGIVRDELGQTHVRLDQVYRGIPVFGQQLIVHLNGDGTLRSITGNYRTDVSGNTLPAITGSKAKEKALKHFSGPVTNDPEAELVFYPLNGEVVLAYRINIEDEETPRNIVAFVDAASGKVVDSYNNLQTPAAEGLAKAQLAEARQASSIRELNSVAVAPAIGTGKSLYSGTINISTVSHLGRYYMLDSTRGAGSTVSGYMRTADMNNRYFGSGTIFSDTDNIWGNYLNTDRATAGVDAHFGAEMTWDYYLNIHKRKGIYNNSIGTLSKVHYGNRYNNAYWSDSCRCMTYGDGNGALFSPLVGLDVVGHEMTHGVTSAVAGLIYNKQSGGLNEAMSDIYGTMIEFYSSAHGAAKTPNYLIGEDIYTPAVPGDALRYMDNPTRDGVSIDTYLNYYDGIDVHYSSGIANNAYYLLAEGGTHRLGGVVTGIGRAKAEKIFFRALDVYMVPSETFSQARAHTIQAASDLYGPGSPEVASVGQAWDAVAVH